MQIFSTRLPDVKLVRSQRHGDDRGWFSEAFSARDFSAAGLPNHFVQDNQSFSRRGVLRGLHYQLGEPQGKLVRVLSGHIWDVAVDLRPNSPDFGKWAGIHLKGEDIESLWIPEGFGHGFLVLSETASVDWPLDGIGTPTVSAKDATGSLLLDAELPPPYEPRQHNSREPLTPS
jgi:dTDP-4-dehydrorhamnose 3,5-epimerase